MAPKQDDKDPGEGTRIDRFALLLEGWSEDLAASFRIWQSRWESFSDRFSPSFPLITFIGILLAMVLAWSGQVMTHVATGGTSPGPGSYGLVPFLSRILLAGEGGGGAWLLILPAMLLLFLLFLFGSGLRRSVPIFQALHLQKESTSPHVYRPARISQFFWFAGFLGSVGLFTVLYLFVLASSRAEAFHPLFGPTTRTDLFLGWFYSWFGLIHRPGWWFPFLVYLLVVPTMVLGLVCWTRMRGISWKDDVVALPSRNPMGLIQWPLAGVVAIVSTIVALKNVGEFPVVIQQDDGIGAWFGMLLTAPGSNVNIFGNDWLPYPSVLPRGFTTALAGNSTEVLRATSALVGGFTILAAFFCYRAIFPMVTSLLLLVLTAASYHVSHFARVGTMHIDTLLYVFLLLGLLLRGELMPPGPRRTLVYLLSGSLAGFLFAQYPAAKLGLMILGLLLVLRVFAQPDFFRHRVKDFGLLLFALIVMATPFHVQFGPQPDRSREVYLLERHNLQSEFRRLERDGYDIRTLDQLLLHHYRNALGVFHDRRDNSHNFSTPFPAASPLVAALSLLGLAVFLARFRSTIAILCVGIFLGACFFGGATRFGPLPPSSSRMITLVPILMIAAGIPILLAEQSFSEFLRRLGRRNITPRFLYLLAGILVAWVILHEVRTNRALYIRVATDPGLHGNAWMMASTQLQRFVESHRPSPDIIYQFGVNETANQTYLHNNYFLPPTHGRRFWISREDSLHPDDVIHPGRTWFIAEESRLDELDKIRYHFPGGRVLYPPPVPMPEVGSFFVIYEVDIHDRPGRVQNAWPWWK